MAKSKISPVKSDDIEIEEDLKRIIEKKRQEKKALMKLLKFIEQNTEKKHNK